MEFGLRSHILSAKADCGQPHISRDQHNRDISLGERQFNRKRSATIVVFKTIDGVHLEGSDRKILDLGCGRGEFAAALAEKGYAVTGVDASHKGIQEAKRMYPHLELFEATAYDDLANRFGRFPVVTSLDVVEHVYLPRRFAACIYSLLEEGGAAIISTPYHGYLKNLALAVTGKMDSHFSALWDHGHIKFWSRRTLRKLLLEAGFSSVEFRYVGGIPPCLARSMIAIAKK